MTRVAIEDEGGSAAHPVHGASAHPTHRGANRTKQWVMAGCAIAALGVAAMLALPEFTSGPTAYAPVADVIEGAPAGGAAVPIARPAPTASSARAIPNPIGGPNANLPPMPGSSRTPEDYERKPRKGTP